MWFKTLDAHAICMMMRRIYMDAPANIEVMRFRERRGEC
jgi:hypothetical protein